MPDMMSRELLDKLKAIAAELKEENDKRCHHIEIALDVDPAFGTTMSPSWLHRELVIDIVKTAARRVGVGFHAVGGSGAELSFSGDRRIDRFRLRSAQRAAHGRLVVIAGADSTLGSSDTGGSTMLEDVMWVFGWTVAEHHAILDVFVARVVGKTEGNPGQLVLVDEHRLIRPASAREIVVREDPLPIFGSEDGGGEGTMPDGRPLDASP